ncbi:MAG: type II toxin-antitoxin system RelE family toxin [Leptolyngbya sp. IPPAS B-1204]|uniref:Type II toxin-antitoxin system RelE/ParE family toxin n=1 Tax=Leptolyngbya sp. NK1-12 TaxID=2547451 RepID=A0AA96WCN8_9CYAN|nr:type II toxin-antitoxin system RelE/ParE family toxin [Leptolyngbya sp. NK1-12]RNJ69153.1 MAG: type II toxin-antitoxin system RelE/ParE family toxin [Leptolyngbya sp. IPPAS B-1204]WNZ23857.1 type II toxin-antitoxin system RelE/ParE family toxin [Leptolyngbya sp. NK1-12]
MSYQVSLLRRAQKELAGISEPAYIKVRDAVRALAEDPRPSGCQKLKGREGWRIRVGDYRVIYEIDDEQQMILVVHIGHRRDIYR